MPAAVSGAHRGRGKNTADRGRESDSRPCQAPPPRSCFTGAKLSLPANGGYSATAAAISQPPAGESAS